MIAEKQSAGPSDYLAAERTFLAWMRTGLAFMGFGFVVARFGLFLQQLQAVQPNLPAQSYGLSLWFGTGLIGLGVLVNLLSLWHHLRLVRELQRGGTAFNRPSSLGIAFAAILAIVGIAMAVYLISIRRHGQLNFQPTPGAIMESHPGNGIISKLSNHSVNDTVAKLQAILEAKGITLFALVDHSGEAAKRGMHMPPTKLLIFGSPKAGTPLMLATPSIAIDLPLKILVAEDAAGKVWISYNDPAYLQGRHLLPAELLPNIAGVEALAIAATK
jgi:uncharacterized protein (DUF302 family)/uncharacterized membrane protein YidH (DUF202 family)